MIEKPDSRVESTNRYTIGRKGRSRRSVMKLAGALGLGGALTSLAGCLGNDVDGEAVQDLTFWAWPSDNVAEYRTSELMAEGVESLGFNVDFQSVSRSRQIEEASNQHNFDFVNFGYTGRPDRVDPMQLAARLSHGREFPGGFNNGGYNTDYVNEDNGELVNNLIDEAQAELDHERRVELVHEFQVRVTNGYDDQPDDFRDSPGTSIPIVHNDLISAYNTEKWSGTAQVPGLGMNNFYNYTGLQAETEDRTFVAIYPNEIEYHVSPLQSSEANRITQRLVHDQLARINTEGLPEPSLATNWEWDEETVTYEIRSGHTFHDGEPVTAEDVAFTFNYLKEWEDPFYSSSVAPMVDDGAEVIDDTTVSITLHEPNAAFDIIAACRVTILPKHIWEHIPDEVPAEAPLAHTPATDEEYGLIGSGPLVFEDWAPGDFVRMGVNQDHWAAPDLDTFVIDIVPSASAAATMLETGDADMIIDGTGNPDVLQDMANEEPHVEFVTTQSVGFFEITMNGTREPLMRPEVRTAIAAAIPRQEILNEAWDGFGTVAQTFLHPEREPWFNQDVRDFSDVSIEQAQEMLEDAGLIVDDGQVFYPEDDVPSDEDKERAIPASAA